MKRLDQKLARIRAGKYKPADFIIADAKDGDMGPSLTSSGPHRAKDGSHIPVDLNTRVITYQGGPAILSTIRDITERKRVETELEASK